jgi:hypothetical protein
VFVWHRIRAAPRLRIKAAPRLQRVLRRVIHGLWCPSLPPLIETLDIWGSLKPDSKLLFYSGWANGLFTTTKDPGTLALGSNPGDNGQTVCGPREGLHNPISTEMIEAVTVAGSPCEGIRAAVRPTSLWHPDN